MFVLIDFYFMLDNEELFCIYLVMHIVYKIVLGKVFKL